MEEEVVNKTEVTEEKKTVPTEDECKKHKGKCCHKNKCQQEEVAEEEFEESAEVLVLKNDISILQDKLKTAQAEQINYRKRKDEEVANRLKYANQDLILEILPILDNFERALKLQNSEDANLSKFLDGIKMIYNSLRDTLKRFGVEEIDCLGKEFDHNLHQAMLVEKDETKPNNTVLEVLIKGYSLKERIIRPAAVKVNKLD